MATIKKLKLFNNLGECLRNIWNQPIKYGELGLDVNKIAEALQEAQHIIFNYSSKISISNLK